MILNMNKKTQGDATLRGLKLRVLKDFTATDRCWKTPESVEVKAGQTVIYEGGGSEAGNISFKVKETGKDIFMRGYAAEPRHPYSQGYINTDYLQPIDWPTELVAATAEVDAVTVSITLDESECAHLRRLIREKQDTTGILDHILDMVEHKHCYNVRESAIVKNMKETQHELL